MNQFNLSQSVQAALTCVLAIVAVSVGCSGTDLGAGSGVGGRFGSIGGSTSGGTKGTGGSTSATGSSGAGGATASGGGNGATGGNLSAAGPTWTQLYNSYFASGTDGDCVTCHGSGTSPAFNSAASLCTVLTSWGYIQGAQSMKDLLTWFNSGGNMPLGGGTSLPSATNDISAWETKDGKCQ